MRGKYEAKILSRAHHICFQYHPTQVRPFPYSLLQKPTHTAAIPPCPRLL